MYLENEADAIAGVDGDRHARGEVTAVNDTVHILLHLPDGKRGVGAAGAEGGQGLRFQVLPIELVAVLVADQDLTDEHPLLALLRILPGSGGGGVGGLGVSGGGIVGDGEGSGGEEEERGCGGSWGY